MRLGYDVKRNTIVYHGTVNNTNPFVPDPSGEYGSGLYCSDTPIVISRYFVPQMEGFRIHELATRVYTHHFKMDQQPTSEELDGIVKVLEAHKNNGSRAFLVKSLEGKFGWELAGLIADLKRDPKRDTENQTIERAAVVERVLSEAGYDGTAAFDVQRGGMVLTFFKPESTLRLRARKSVAH